MATTARQAYRQQYEHQVAELGEGDEFIDEAAQAAAVRRARLLVCGHATDAADAQQLLEHLGLAPGQERELHRVHSAVATATASPLPVPMGIS